MKDSQFKAAIMKMIDSFRPYTYENSHAPKARNEHVSKRQMTKKGAVHTQGRHFLGRMIRPGLTPALYRRLHLGKPVKKEEAKNVS